MQKFNSLKSIPAYLPIVNIDTDMIIPKQFLKTIKELDLEKIYFLKLGMIMMEKKLKILFLIKNLIINQNFNYRKKFWVWIFKRTCSLGVIRFWNYMRDKL